MSCQKVEKVGSAKWSPRLGSIVPTRMGWGSYHPPPPPPISTSTQAQQQGSAVRCSRMFPDMKKQGRPSGEAPPGITEAPVGHQQGWGQCPGWPPIHLIVGVAPVLQRGAAVAEGGSQHEVSGIFLCLAVDVPQCDVHHILDGLGETNPVVTHWLGRAPSHPPQAGCNPPWVILAGIRPPQPPLPPGGTWR